MNQLSVLIVDNCDLSFELRVDDQPIGTQVDAPGTLIPHRYIDTGLPSIPPYPDEVPLDANKRLIAVCKCGEYGCGHAECRVILAADCVIFKDFSNSRSNIAQAIEFVFSRANYQEVISSIVLLANSHRGTTSNRSA